MKESRFCSLLYRLMLKYDMMPIIGHFLNLSRNYLARRLNPVICYTINGQKIFMPFSHMLPFYQKHFPEYDCQLRKIYDIIRENSDEKQLVDVDLGWGGGVVDVGANIGDTVINMGIKDVKYLLIEGEKQYAQFIDANLKEYNYSLEQCFLADYVLEDSYESVAVNGTGHLQRINSDKVNNVAFMTLDELLETKYKDFVIDLLKIDTDGFDFRVLRGAVRALKRQKPVLYFEWSSQLLKEQGEDCVSIFCWLHSLGYEEAILFDNFGQLLTVISTSDSINFELLVKYEENINTKIEYYDVLLFHRSFPITYTEILHKYYLH